MSGADIRKKLVVALTVGSSLATLAFAAPAHAQSTEAENSVEDQADSGGLAQIIVTANKRSENVQDVPISVSVVSGNSLAQAGVIEVAKLQQLAPGVFIAPIGNTTQTIVRIRGVGTSGTNNGFESAVGVFVDGVFRPRAGQALGNFVDVSRVEVLRGPQGTLFGKNTTAGAISIITNEPSFDFGGSVSASIGNFQSRRVEAMVTGPLSDTVAFRFAGNYTKRDGIQDKLLPGTSINPTRVKNFFNDRDRFIVKGQLLFEPNDDLRIKLIGDYSEIDEVGNVGQPKTTPARFNGLFPVLKTFLQPDNQLKSRQTQVNSDPFEKTKDAGVTAEISYDFGGAKLTSISAWRDYKTQRSFDLDLVGYDVLGPLPEFQNIKLKTQEFQLAGAAGSLNWLVGAYLFDEKINFGTDIRLGTQFAQFAGLAPAFVPLGTFAGQGFNQVGFQTNKGYSFFSQNSLNITDKLQITAGIRYNYSKKRGVSIHNGAAVVPSTTPGVFSVNDPFCALAHIASICFNRSIDVKRSESAWTGTAKIKYDFSNAVNAYFSYSRGYKAGGINLDRESIDDRFGVVTDLSNFRSESVDSYEFGMKSEWLDRRLRANLAIYQMDFGNFQLNSFNGVSFTIINVPAKAKGVEFDIVAAPADGVNFNLSIAHNRAKFADDLSGIALASPFSGKDLPSSPHWQVSSGFNIDQKLGSGLRGLFNANISMISDYNAGSQGDPTQVADGYFLLGGSIGLRTNDDRFGAKISVSNLLNETVPTFITATILQTGGRYAFLNDPRTFQLTLDAKF